MLRGSGARALLLALLALAASRDDSDFTPTTEELPSDEPASPPARTLDDAYAGMDRADLRRVEWEQIEDYRADRTLASHLQELQEQAGHGNDTAIAALAELYLLGDKGIAVDLERGLELARRAAKTGNPSAQVLLAFALLTGRAGAWPPSREAQEEAHALMWVAALGQHPGAQAAQAYWHQRGLYAASEDCEVALEFAEAASSHVAEAQAGDGLVDFPAEDYGHVAEITDWPRGGELSRGDLLAYYGFLADTGQASAMVALGHAHVMGAHGLAKDYAAARAFFEQAAQEGDPNGKAGLALLYEEGLGVEQDNATSARLYKFAADRGNFAAMTRLALLQLRGQLGLQRDETRSIVMLTRAAEGGWARAQLALADVYNGVEPTKTIARDTKAAMKWYAMASARGNLAATHELAALTAVEPGGCSTSVYMFRRVAERSDWVASCIAGAEDMFEAGEYNKALARYELAAMTGLEVAQASAAWMYQRSLGFPPSFYINATTANETLLLEKAREYYKLSADQVSVVGKIGVLRLGDVQVFGDSFVQLGDMYYYGQGVPEDREIAFRYYTFASDVGNGQAMFNIAEMYHFGLSVPEDLEMAKRYYDMAAKQSGTWLPTTLALVLLRTQMAFRSMTGSSSMSLDSLEESATALIGTILATLILFRILNAQRR